MIIAIHDALVYGRQGTVGINALDEMTVETVVYAHGLEDAKAWASNGRELNWESLGDGRWIYQSEWIAEEDHFAGLFGDGFTHTMRRVILVPMTTV